MVKLLECQEAKLVPEDLELFAIALLCSLLEIYEDDLSTNESIDIRHFCQDWCKK